MPQQTAKPASVFGRDTEWRALTAFATRSAPRATLGVVSGRRRMGKTFLLRALVERLGGFYFGATEATATESLRQFGAALAAHTGSPARFAFATWDEAITTLFRHGSQPDGPDGSSDPGGRSFLVVVDEFPYLTRATPEIPSLIQRELDRYQTQSNRLRLLLCGSAMSVMGGLLAGTAPLRGRAGLELVVQPFGYRDAAEFWTVGHQPGLAARLHAVVGGTPAYRHQFLADDTPGGDEEFDDWICRTVLSPVSPMFREARYLLAEEAEIRDPALYQSVLAAVAEGNATRGGIASYIGRKAVDIAHPLNVLRDCRLLVRENDLFRSGRSWFRIAEPLVTFYQAIMRPSWARLEAGQAEPVWRESAPRFASQVVGPHFEAICREYLLLSGHRVLGSDAAGEVGTGVVTDPARRQQIQIDAAVLAPGSPTGPRRVLALGEAKWGTVLGLGHLDRLARARDVLAARGHDTGRCRLVCFGAAGFDPGLRDRTAEDPSVKLVDVAALYDPAT
ncbi:MAG TPA: ATP-binding protein [Mycobacteriales bacterium]|nr:ATP-binding protein [Mycobacteriales bacterium]